MNTKSKTGECYVGGGAAFSGKVHWAFGMLLLGMFWMNDTYLNPVTFMIGAMLPDCDIRYSTTGKILPLWIFFGHRTWTHTIWAILFFAGLVTLLWDWWAGLSLAVGYTLHLLLDSMTPSGVNWLRMGKRKRPSK